MANLTLQPSPENNPTEFVPVTGGSETTSAESLLIIAYLVMWAILMLYILMTWRRQSSLDQRLDEAEKELRAKLPDDVDEDFEPANG
jgi:CcmD family protein